MEEEVELIMWLVVVLFLVVSQHLKEEAGYEEAVLVEMSLAKRRKRERGRRHRHKEEEEDGRGR
ncbi:hypothetical protein N665_0254s0013 [Sinapis alba]|nr:hypothetical protein N665_0254s0013 [Sinapis alba]